MSDSAYVFQGNSLVVPEETSQLEEAIPVGTIQQGFGSLDIVSIDALYEGGTIQSVDLDPKTPLPPGWRTISMRELVNIVAMENMVDGTGTAGRLLRAYHISQWRRESVFCGSCGSRNQDTSLARRCPACGRVEFPRISPAIITLISNDKGQALLAHNRNFTPGVYSLIAGFTEAGESLESTVKREIREEVSLEVRDIRYQVSQPWPFPNSLMLGFTARHSGGNIQVDGVELEDARWFDPDKLPLLPGYGSVSRYLINKWISGEFSS
ncbi:MAG: NAD(+) diphosphatase [Treponema sp.]|jgi:NAD+ diphosphatase|nr:NAD(+) diphosphatase [Treponema sp.]